MKKLILALLVPLLLVAPVNAQFAKIHETGDNDFLSTIRDEPKYSGHPFTHAEYMKTRSYEPFPAVVFTFDDGDSSFLTDFVMRSDSLYDTYDTRWAGNAAALARKAQIKGTGCVMPRNQDGVTGKMQPEDFNSLNSRQHIFEIALHGNNDDRLGFTLTKNEAGGDNFYSYEHVDTTLAEAQDSLLAWGCFPARSALLSNHRFTHGMQDVWMKHGIYNVLGKAINVATDRSSLSVPDDGGSTMPNSDVLTNALINYGSRFGWQRHARIDDRWNIGRHSPYDNTGEDAQEVIALIDVAVQTNSMALIAFHEIEDPTDHYLDIEPDSLYKIMVHVDSLIALGMIETLTVEQMVFRGTGHVHGRLWNNDGFVKLGDYSFNAIDTELLSLGAGAATDSAPIGWPLVEFPSGVYWGEQESDFWNGGGETDKYVYKVHDLGTLDTLWALHVIEEGSTAGADTTINYGLTDPDGNVILTAMPNAGYSYPIGSGPISISGVQARYINISALICTDATPPAGAYVAIQGVIAKENRNDYINTGAGAFRFDGLGGKFTHGDPEEEQRTRLKSGTLSGQDSTITETTDITMRHHYFPGLQPFVSFHERVNVANAEAEAQFGNTIDWQVDGTAAGDHDDEVPIFEDPLKWVNATWRIELPPDGWFDSMAFILIVESYSGSWSIDDEIIISDISVWAGQ